MALANAGSSEKYLALLQELESDDELPDDYRERPEIPAYLDDHRFDTIKCNWVYKYLEDNHTKLESNTQSAFKIESPAQKSPEHKFSKGILKHQDVYCLKSLASCASSSTLVWFVNFLMLKDAEYYYQYRKSCLVNDAAVTATWPIKNQGQESPSNCGKLKIVIKEQKTCICPTEKLSHELKLKE